MKTLTSNNISWLSQFVDDHTENSEERLRLYIFLLFFILNLITWGLHLSGIAGLSYPYLQVLSVINLLFGVLCFCLVAFRKLSLSKVFLWFAIITQVLQTIRVILLGIYTPDHYIDMLSVNLFISYALLLYTSLGLVRYAPSVIMALSVGSLIVVKCMNPDDVSNSLIMTIFNLELATVIGAAFAERIMHKLQNEKTAYQNTEESMLSAFGIEKTQLLHFIELCRNKEVDGDNYHRFFDTVDPQTEENIIHAVKQRITERELHQHHLCELFPMLSDTEILVSEYVIKGLSIKDIARSIGKNTNNISAVRGNIRKKLGLAQEQDLRQYLQSSLSRRVAEEAEELQAL